MTAKTTEQLAVADDVVVDSQTLQRCHLASVNTTKMMYYWQP